MAERKWITREEIAEIYDQRAIIAFGKGDLGSSVRLANQAIEINKIEKIYSPNLDSHIYNTRQANKTGRLAR